MGIFVLERQTEKEGFEPSRRVKRPIPLAGAPLRPLEYFSEYCRTISSVYMIVYDSFSFVNHFPEISSGFFFAVLSFSPKWIVRSLTANPCIFISYYLYSYITDK